MNERPKKLVTIDLLALKEGLRKIYGTYRVPFVVEGQIRKLVDQLVAKEYCFECKADLHHENINVIYTLETENTALQKRIKELERLLLLHAERESEEFKKSIEQLPNRRSQ
jgi:hypothetical protein